MQSCRVICAAAVNPRFAKKGRIMLRGLMFRAEVTTRRSTMAKYLFEARYTAEGIKGVAREGGSGRRSAVEKLAQGLGGKLEAFYYAFGDVDAYVIIDCPDSVTAAAAALAINQSGTVTVKT